MDFENWCYWKENYIRAKQGESFKLFFQAASCLPANFVSVLTADRGVLLLLSRTFDGLQKFIFSFKNWVLIQRLVLALNAKWIILKFFFLHRGEELVPQISTTRFLRGNNPKLCSFGLHHIAWVSHIAALFSLYQSCFVRLDLFSRTCSWIVYTRNAHFQIYLLSAVFYACYFLTFSLMCQQKFWLILFSATII